MSYRVINGKLYESTNFDNYAVSKNTRSSKASDSFSDILKSKLKDNQVFSISNHAAQRLESRDIKFSESDMVKINEGINLAEEKGAKDCLILYKDVALVASVKNRTIITAVDKENGKGNVFTNLDSVVLL